MRLAALRKEYHRSICQHVLRLTNGVPNMADKDNRASMAIGLRLIELLGYPVATDKVTGQSKGKRFEQVTRDFLNEAFSLLLHVRPGEWGFEVGPSIARFEQYRHLAYLQETLTKYPELASALGGDYLVEPDIVVARFPLSDEEIDRFAPVLDDSVARHSPLRAINRSGGIPLLHASISCKWTIRSDRSQNVRTEALNLIRNRKGHTPQVMVVAAEPLPTRLASLALGTGDLDCVYHFALPELVKAVEAVSEDQLDMLHTMIDGNRLRDISDLPLDLAV
ncbi:MAG: restriction endonuclease [Anaerolineae bacterium]|nr:restriction endonuclease [Anaerolineae bacterium]